MKKIGEYTCRGQVASEVTERVILDDGRFNTGYRVVEFSIAAQRIDNSDDAYGTLFTDKTGSGTNEWNWQANGQIAWAALVGQSNAASSPFSLVDPDNLVIQDLFVRAKENGGSPVNYFIRMEKYEIPEWTGALAMVRNNSQAV
jgi:hypothetical protein